jgi:hypothetical protein
MVFKGPGPRTPTDTKIYRYSSSSSDPSTSMASASLIREDYCLLLSFNVISLLIRIHSKGITLNVGSSVLYKRKNIFV